MSASEIVSILPSAAYECVRCRTRVSKEELDALPSPRCASCGFTVFSKVRPALVKRVQAL